MLCEYTLSWRLCFELIARRPISSVWTVMNVIDVLLSFCFLSQFVVILFESPLTASGFVFVNLLYDLGIFLFFPLLFSPFLSFSLFRFRSLCFSILSVSFCPFLSPFFLFFTHPVYFSKTLSRLQGNMSVIFQCVYACVSSLPWNNDKKGTGLSSRQVSMVILLVSGSGEWGAGLEERAEPGSNHCLNPANYTPSWGRRGERESFLKMNIKQIPKWERERKRHNGEREKERVKKERERER